MGRLAQDDNPAVLMEVGFQKEAPGAGEIFVYAMAYEAAFEVAPKEQKGMASAFNLFLIGSVPGFFLIARNITPRKWDGHCTAALSHSRT